MKKDLNITNDLKTNYNINTGGSKSITKSKITKGDCVKRTVEEHPITTTITDDGNYIIENPCPHCAQKDIRIADLKDQQIQDLKNDYDVLDKIIQERDLEIQKLTSIVARFKEMRRFFKKGSPLTEMMDKIITENNL